MVFPNLWGTVFEIDIVMTLGELVQVLGENSFYPIFLFLILPFSALLGNIMAKGEGHESPWCFFYTALIYLSVIPGIFSILLNLFHMMFEKRSIYQTNMVTDILPIVSMIVTLILIKRNVPFSAIPGFGKMTGFLSIVACIMVLFFFVEKTNLFIFSALPFTWILIILLVVFAVIRLGTKKLFS